jgi:hypothetical protein
VPKFNPPQKRFHPSSIDIAPNELVLFDAQTPWGAISTGVMVMYAGADSFTLMTPAEHPEAGSNAWKECRLVSTIVFWPPEFGRSIPIALSILVLAGCSPKAPTPSEVVRPVKTMIVSTQHSLQRLLHLTVLHFAFDASGATSAASGTSRRTSPCAAGDWGGILP